MVVILLLLLKVLKGMMKSLLLTSSFPVHRPPDAERKRPPKMETFVGSPDGRMTTVPATPRPLEPV